MLEKTPNVDFYQDMVKGVVIKEGKACGVITGLGHEIRAKAVVLTNGTFLKWNYSYWEKNFGGGRAAEKAATGITEQLVSLGFESDRLKNRNTAPGGWTESRLFENGRTAGDEEISGFSYLDTPKPKQQRSCWITYTNQKVHDILKTGFDQKSHVCRSD